MPLPAQYGRTIFASLARSTHVACGHTVLITALIVRNCWRLVIFAYLSSCLVPYIYNYGSALVKAQAIIVRFFKKVLVHFLHMHTAQQALPREQLSKL